MKNNLINFFIIGLIVLGIFIVFFINDKNNKISSKNNNDNPLIEDSNQQTESNDIIASNSVGRPVQFTLEVLNFDVKFPENRLPYSNVNAGDKVIMRLTFLPGEDIDVATLQPWLYRVGQEPVIEGITKELPLELRDVKRLQNYSYEFTLFIPETPKDTKYDFAVFMSGCYSQGCGGVGIDFVVGDGEPLTPPGNTLAAVATTE